MNIFKHLFILGRPAAGKSEFIDFMKRLSDDDRARMFHIGKFEEVDDFPWIWEACQGDDAREKRGEGRLYSERTEEGYNLKSPTFRSDNQHKFNDVIRERYLNRPKFYSNGTLLIEFARGKGDGFKISLEKMDDEILKGSAILYIDVSFEESFRRNNARYDAAAKESILFHKVPDKDMYGYFIKNDWEEITSGKPCGYLDIRGAKVPFVSMCNEPESKDPQILRGRYGTALSQLWDLKQQ